MRYLLFPVALLATSGCVADPSGGLDASQTDTSTPDTSTSGDGAAMDTGIADSGGDAPSDAADSGPKKNFSCGTPTVCDFGTQTCCYTSPNNTGGCVNPQADGGPPVCGAGQYGFQCSATNQCAMGEVCCASQSKLNGPNPWNSRCGQTCSSGLANLKVFCANTSECVSGTCQAVGAGFPLGYKECK